MIQKRGKFGRSILARLGMALAAVVLVPAASVVTVASPAAAAPPDMFMRNVAVNIFGGFSVFCLDQHYAGSTPTTTVFAWTPCHTGGLNSPGNQLWRHEPVEGNTIRIVNKRGGYTWCLSAPNGGNRDVAAELCVPGVPAKQRWQPEYLSEYGANRLRSLNTNDQCLTSIISQVNGGVAAVQPCSRRFGNQHWTWS